MKRFSLFLILLLVSGLASANSSEALKNISHKIANIKAALHQDQSKRSEYLQQLKKTEIESSNVQKKLKKIKRDIEHQKAILLTLQKNETQYQSKIAKQQAQLAEQVRIIYLLGREPYLKLLLNQSSISQMSRTMTYFSYISQKQITTINALQDNLDKLKANQEEIITQRQKSEKLRSEQEQQRQTLKRVAQNRQHIINKINAKINTKNKKLSALLHNKKLLENTLANLEKEKSSSRTSRFDRLKGRMAWPTRGRVLPYFGKPIQHSELTWTGILIRAPEDTPVHAIAAGKVVFSKWMPGYGLLLIIDHGNGYMSLYGRNHSLYKKPGDSVSKGELIATVGQSGGYQTPALYFAIRHNAKALNPVKWCTNKA